MNSYKVATLFVKWDIVASGKKPGDFCCKCFSKENTTEYTLSSNLPHDYFKNQDFFFPCFSFNETLFLFMVTSCNPK